MRIFPAVSFSRHLQGKPVSIRVISGLRPGEWEAFSCPSLRPEAVGVLSAAERLCHGSGCRGGGSLMGEKDYLWFKWLFKTIAGSLKGPRLFIASFIGINIGVIEVVTIDIIAVTIIIVVVRSSYHLYVSCGEFYEMCHIHLLTLHENYNGYFVTC